MNLRNLSSAVILLIVANYAVAQSPKNPIISKNEASKNASRLTREIAWNTSLPQAKLKAEREGKLVFWMHILGKIDGDT